jgi:DNA repair exonuclease SbcCD ATPase subunit
MDLTGIAQEVRARRLSHERRAGQAQVVREHLEAARGRVAMLEQQVEVAQETQALLTSLGEEQQETARAQLEGLATRAMQVIFGEELSFHLVPSVKAGQQHLEFVVRSRNGKETVDTPVSARGGGMRAVLGFVMRLVVLLLTPEARKVLFLDESFSFVSRGYEDRVAEFLAEVAHKAGVQIVLITHSPAYEQWADKTYRLEQKTGLTVVHEGETE